MPDTETLIRAIIGVIILVLILAIRPIRRFFFALICQIIFNPVVCGLITTLFFFGKFFLPYIRQPQNLIDLWLQTVARYQEFMSGPISLDRLIAVLPALVPWLLIVARALVIGDSIRDIVHRTFYKYEIGIRDIEIGGVLLVKGLLCLFTLGYVRIIYILVVYPIMKHLGRKPIRQALHSMQPIRFGIPGYFPRWKAFYYWRYLVRLRRHSKLISAQRIIDDELQSHQRKYDSYEPQNILQNMVLFFNREKKQEKRDRQSELNRSMNQASNAREIYFGRKAIKAIGRASYEYLEASGTARTPRIIAQQDSIQNYGDSSITGSNSWLQYFVILSLEPYVEKGTVIDERKMTNRSTDSNHSYRIKGKSSKIAKGEMHRMGKLD